MSEQMRLAKVQAMDDQAWMGADAKLDHIKTYAKMPNAGDDDAQIMLCYLASLVAGHIHLLRAKREASHAT